MWRVGLCALLVLAACDGKDAEETDTVAMSGPTLTHTPPAGVVEGNAITFDVVAEDADDVRSVTLYHRITGESAFQPVTMTAGDAGTWTAVVESEDVAAPGVDYYFKAADAGATSATSYLPESGASAPFVVAVNVQGLPVPFFEDFELLEEEEDTLQDIGWANATVGFRGYGWDLSTAQLRSGVQSVYHSRGHSETGPMEDWLIGPALDFSTLSDAQVAWWEYGNNVEVAAHSLYVSTGSRDPESGDWVLVADALRAPPEDAWGASQVVDLSAWAGSSTVYVAWVFTGTNADDWWIDDVQVSPLAPFFDTSFTVEPSPIRPGDSGVLTLEVANGSTVDAADLTVTVTFPEGGASTDEGSVTVPSLAAGTTSLEDFTLHVDAETADNSYVPVTITIAEGDTTTEIDGSLLVGLQSIATITYTPSAEESVALVLGVGDPDAPAWERTIYSELTADTVSLTLDVTDDHAMLPPAAGADRWFVRANPSVGGTLEEFTLTVDGVDYRSGDVPAVIVEETVVYLPTPPAFDVTTTTTPTVLSPGDIGSTLTLAVRNVGSDSSGPIVASFASADADLTVTEGGPITLSADTLATDEVAAVTAFSFDVAASHTDSTDVNAVLTLSDDLETWDVPLRLEVPYPVMRITTMEIDDDGHDAVLDAGESAELTLRVTNAGDASSSGIVFGSLTAEATGTAIVDVSTNVESFGSISAGNTKEGADPWDITVLSGADGDTVDLLLTLVDNDRTYEVRTTLVLGESPWQPLSALDDAVSDALDSWDFDIVNGRWRVNDGDLEMELTSDTVFDPTTLFVEMWGQSPGSDWLFHRLIVQGAVVTMEGYGNSGFVDIATATLTYPDAYTVRVSVPTADLGLLLNEFAVGFASGWCGPPDYYCDHFADGWGYPYVAYTTADWFDLSW